MKKVNYPLALTVAIIAGLVLLAACGTSTPETEEPSDSLLPEAAEQVEEDSGDGLVAAPDIEMEIAGFAFAQPTLTVPAGTTVIWHNNDAAAHTVTTIDPLFGSELLSRDGTFSYTFEQPGEYDYYCTIHPYMRATVTVE